MTKASFSAMMIWNLVGSLKFLNAVICTATEQSKRFC